MPEVDIVTEDNQLITKGDRDGHVVYYPFGKTFMDDDRRYLDIVDHYLRTAPAVSPIMAKLVMRELYERGYNIHSHEDGRLSPLHLVCMHNKENVTEFSPAYNKIRRFIKLGVGKELNMSMVDFFNMPHEYVEHVFRTIADINENKLNEKNPLKDFDK